MLYISTVEHPFMHHCLCESDVPFLAFLLASPFTSKQHADTPLIQGLKNVGYKCVQQILICVF